MEDVKKANLLMFLSQNEEDCLEKINELGHEEEPDEEKLPHELLIANVGIDWSASPSFESQVGIDGSGYKEVKVDHHHEDIVTQDEATKVIGRTILHERWTNVLHEDQVRRNDSEHRPWPSCHEGKLTDSWIGAILPDVSEEVVEDVKSGGRIWPSTVLDENTLELTCTVGHDNGDV